MARAEIPLIIIDPATGNAIVGASVAVKLRATGATATVYAAETGATTVTNPRTSDANGRVSGWCDRGAYQFDISGTGLTSYTEYWDAATSSDGGLDTAWLADGAVTSAKILDATIATGDLADASITAAKMASGLALPTGMVNPFAGTAAPTGWLLCDGSEVSRTTYAALDTVLTTTYGAYTNGSGGVGTTHLRVPDLRGRSVAGKDNMGGTTASRLTSGGSGIVGTTLGGVGGLETHTLTTAQLASHTHTATYSYPLWNVSVTNGAGYLATNAALDSKTLTTDATGGGAAHNNAQPTMILNYIIKS